MRVFTSQNTSARASRATTSSSPYRVRKLRSTTSNPRASRCRTASSSPRAPSLRRGSVIARCAPSRRDRAGRGGRPPRACPARRAHARQWCRCLARSPRPNRTARRRPARLGGSGPRVAVLEGWCGRLPDADTEQLVQDVLGPADRGRAVLQQVVGPAGDAGGDPSWHRGHAPAEVLGELGRNQAAARIGGLDNKGHAGKAGHDPVTGREAPSVWLGAGRELREHQAGRPHALVERAVAARIDHVGPARHHGDGHAAAVQAATVSRAVDAQREAADHRHAGGAQAPPSAYATSVPYGLARRVPTRVTAGSPASVPSTSAEPAPNSTAGGSGRSWSDSG